MAEDKKSTKKAAGNAAAEKTVARTAAPEKKSAVSLALPVVIAIGVVALLAGLLVGHFVNLPGQSSVVAGKTTIAEADLDSPVASYVYDGKTYSLSARDVILANSSLTAAKQDDGTYSVPSADNILTTARNQILAKAVEAKGITVTDDEVAAYAESTLSSSDYATIASQYSMDEDQVKSILKQSAATKKLYNQVVDVTTTSLPTAPTTPATGQEDVATADYGTYIVNLLGDEWDSTNNTWARTDGPYYSAMSSMTFSKDSATYTQAQTAYYVAYQQYSQTATSASTEWTNYVNGLLDNATITINTLLS